MRERGFRFVSFLKIAKPNTIPKSIQIINRDSDLTTFKKLSNLNSGHLAYNIISNQFRKFFQSYALAFNKQQNRIGTLFQTPFKRELVESNFQLKELISQIHLHPQKIKLKIDFRDWKWSSYNIILNDKPSKLYKNEVLKLFGGIEQFKKYHSDRQKLIGAEMYILEDWIFND